MARIQKLFNALKTPALTLTAIFLPLLVAANGDSDPPTSSTPPSGDYSLSFKLDNPLPNTDSIPAFILKVIDVLFIIAAPIIAIFIIYSGFLFVTAAGNTEKLKKAKETFLYTVIGAAILLAAKVIATALQNTIGSL